MYQVLLVAALACSGWAQQFGSDDLCNSVCPYNRCPSRRPVQAISDCPDGFIANGDNCYVYGPYEKNWGQAENACLGINATLLTIENIDEINVLNMHVPRQLPNWIGLSGDARGALRWEAQGGVDPNQLPWADKGAAHGQNSVANCAAYWVPSVGATPYTHFYPCDSKFFYICKKHRV